MPKNNDLGKALIRQKNCQHAKFSSKHSVEPESQDFSRLPIKSLTEESSFSQFLNIAALANTDFTAEKKSFRLVDPKESKTFFTHAKRHEIDALQVKYVDKLTIPRRPKWNKEMTREELHESEREKFLEWRRTLAEIEDKGLTMTPYEKNLDFWRQLWRVTERSDVLIQIVDARNPLLYFSSDLNAYVREVSEEKQSILLLNKSDLLTEKQRQYWSDYFNEHNIKALFWSAMKGDEASVKPMSSIPEDQSEVEENKKDEEPKPKENQLKFGEVKFNDPHVLSKVEMVNFIVKLAENFYAKKNAPQKAPASSKGSSDGEESDGSYELSEDEAMPEKYYSRRPFTVGFVGYPNVGKSSTLNTLIGSKRVSVSATPGHTKHLQTIFLSPNILFCDCPGLVFPSFVHTRSDLVVSGILSVDENRDFIGPVNVICSQIPKSVFETLYGANIKPPPEGDDPDRPVVAYELLGAICYMRGFMTSTGVPHYDRAARVVVKDYFNGRLLYVHPPPSKPLDVYLYESPGLMPKDLKRVTRWQEKLDKSVLLQAHIADSCSLSNKRKARNVQQAKIAQSEADNILTRFDKMILQDNQVSDVKKRSFASGGQRSKRHIPRLVDEEKENQDDDDTQSISSLATSSRFGNVGGKNLLSGVNNMTYRSDEVYRGSDADDWETATSITAGQAWRRLSESKKVYFPGALLVGNTQTRGTARPRKKKEKLRRIYSSLDQHDM